MNSVSIEILSCAVIPFVYRGYFHNSPPLQEWVECGCRDLGHCVFPLLYVTLVDTSRVSSFRCFPIFSTFIFGTFRTCACIPVCSVLTVACCTGCSIIYFHFVTATHVPCVLSRIWSARASGPIILGYCSLFRRICSVPSFVSASNTCFLSSILSCCITSCNAVSNPSA